MGVLCWSAESLCCDIEGKGGGCRPVNMAGAGAEGVGLVMASKCFIVALTGDVLIWAVLTSSDSDAPQTRRRYDRENLGPVTFMSEGTRCLKFS